MPTPLNRIIIFVGDVEKCAAFYQEAFGFAALPSDISACGMDWAPIPAAAGWRFIRPVAKAAR